CQYGPGAVARTFIPWLAAVALPLQRLLQLRRHPRLRQRPPQPPQQLHLVRGLLPRQDRARRRGCAEATIVRTTAGCADTIGAPGGRSLANRAWLRWKAKILDP